MAALTALGGTGLQLAAHRPPALAAFTGFGVLGVAIVFYNQMIELPYPYASRLTPRQAESVLAWRGIAGLQAYIKEVLHARRFGGISV